MTDQAPVVEEVDGFFVVRDDLHLGGTKARVADLLFDDCEELVYASPAEGYAQVALAVAARRIRGASATIFVAARKKQHRHTELAADLGAKIVEVRPGYLGVVSARAKEYAEMGYGRKLAPFGFDSEEIVEEIADVASWVADRYLPEEVWSVAGSGTLSRALQRAFPADIPVVAVRIGRELKPEQVGRAALLEAPERFAQDAKHPPPFPSNRNYDAKAWQFIRRYAPEGSLFWNVAA